MERPIVRKATRKDSAGFLKLLVALARFERLQPPNKEAKQRIIEDVFAKNRAHIFIALLGERPVGYALYFYTYSSFLARPTLYLEDIFVLEEFRGQGIGLTLLMRCVKEAAKEDCGRMEWAVLVWNESAIKFYEKLGARRMADWYTYRLTSESLKALSRAKTGKIRLP